MRHHAWIGSRRVKIPLPTGPGTPLNLLAHSTIASAIPCPSHGNASWGQQAFQPLIYWPLPVQDQLSGGIALQFCCPLGLAGTIRLTRLMILWNARVDCVRHSSHAVIAILDFLNLSIYLDRTWGDGEERYRCQCTVAMYMLSLLNGQCRWTCVRWNASISSPGISWFCWARRYCRPRDSVNGFHKSADYLDS
jgi:hypothetical protein